MYVYIEGYLEILSLPMCLLAIYMILKTSDILHPSHIECFHASKVSLINNATTN